MSIVDQGSGGHIRGTTEPKDHSSPPYADPVPAEIKPPELARIVDFSERSRTDDWSLRSALVLYALPQPQRVNDILVHVRRVDRELGKQSKRLGREGTELWGALQSDAGGDELVELLRAARELDELGDVIVAWAVDRTGESPDARVDAVVADVGRRLDALGIPYEERPGPRNRGV